MKLQKDKVHMQRDVHIAPRDLLNSLQFKDGDFAPIALVSGQPHRAQTCLTFLQDAVKNFTFFGYTFWTGTYKGKRVTVGNGGYYSPDTAFVTELLAEGGVEYLIRLGSCGAMDPKINVGDLIIADELLRGDGATPYYVDEKFIPKTDSALTKNIKTFFEKDSVVHQGKVWTTDALFRETKEVVNTYIDKGAIGVDMVSGTFVTVANTYKKKSAALLCVSDNLITGQLGFSDIRFYQSERQMIDKMFGFVETLNI